MTSAPHCERMPPATGVNAHIVMSTTRTPVRGPAISCAPCSRNESGGIIALPLYRMSGGCPKNRSAAGWALRDVAEGDVAVGRALAGHTEHALADHVARHLDGAAADHARLLEEE